METKDWQELYEGAREVFGPNRAAIFMRAMDRGLRDDWATKADLAELRWVTKADLAELRGATKADLADLRVELHSALRAQTWRLAGLVVAMGGLTFGIARVA